MKPKIIILFLISLMLFNNIEAQWIVKNLNEDQRYQGIVKFKNDSLGFYMGGNSTFLKTTDMGETWHLNQLNINVSINDFQFIGDSSIFAVGNYYNSIGQHISGKIIKSENLGIDWDSIANFDGKQFLSMHFFDTETGVVAGYNGMYRTTNSGASWDTVWHIVQNGGYQYGSMQHLNFPTTQIGYAVGTGRNHNNNPSFDNFLLKSSNSGLTWDSLKSFPFSLISIYFLNEDTGYIGDGSGGLHKTVDGGNSWVELPNVASGIPIKSIQFISKNNGFATGGEMNILTGGGAGSSFSILKTIDGGSTWTSYDTVGIPLNSIWFLNDTTGFVSGDFELIMKSEGKIDGLPNDYPWYLVGTSGVDDNETSNSNIHVYPNPTNGTIFIRNIDSNRPIKSISLINASGQSVFIQNQISEIEPIQMVFSEQKPGIYIVKIGFSDKAEFVKIVKK